MTVSRALDPARAHLVREQTRTKIQNFCASSGYQPNFQARSLASGRTGTIGMIMPWIATLGTSPASSRFLKLLTTELETRGLTLSLLAVANDSMKTIFAEVLKTFRSRKADGFLSLASFVKPEAAAELVREKVPLATFAMPTDDIQSAHADIPNVRIDETAATRELYDRLAECGGVAVIGVPPRAGGRHLRYEQLAKMVRGACFDIPRGRFFESDNAADAMAGIRMYWDNLRRYPAWLCQNDRIAYGAALELQAHGLEPGRDVALAGFDDMEAGRNDAFFTTVRPPYEALARVCAENICAVLSGHAPKSSQTVLNSELIFRASTPNLNQKGTK